MSLRERRAEIVLLLGSVAVFLLFAEGVVRVLGADRPKKTGYAPVNTNRRAMRPKNARGYRDRQRAIPKPEGVRRVVSLGDSFAWGASVEFEDAYPQRLERALTRRRCEAWEVVNLALPGMNTVDQAAQLESEGGAYQPDVVVVGYVLNDSEDANAAEARRAEDWAEPKRPEPRLADRSALLRMVRGRLWATVENRRRVTGYLSMYDERASGWTAGRAALMRIGAWCRQHGVPLVVMVFPLFGNPLDESYPFAEVHAKIAPAAAAAGAKVVDLLPAYRDLRWDILVADGVDDEHPNEIAHRIAATVLLRALDEVVPWTTGSAATGDDPESSIPRAPSAPSPPPR